MRALFCSFSYAFAGLSYAIRTQRNLRIHLAIAAIVILAGLIFKLSTAEWAIMLLTIGVVISAELINTVAELAVDLLTQEYHPMAKVAKDVGAAAVVTTAMAAVGVGLAIFGPRLWHLLFK